MFSDTPQVPLHQAIQSSKIKDEKSSFDTTNQQAHIIHISFSHLSSFMFQFLFTRLWSCIITSLLSRIYFNSILWFLSAASSSNCFCIVLPFFMVSRLAPSHAFCSPSCWMHSSAHAFETKRNVTEWWRLLKMLLFHVRLSQWLQFDGLKHKATSWLLTLPFLLLSIKVSYCSTSVRQQHRSEDGSSMMKQNVKKLLFIIKRFNFHECFITLHFQESSRSGRDFYERNFISKSSLLWSLHISIEWKEIWEMFPIVESSIKQKHWEETLILCCLSWRCT